MRDKYFGSHEFQQRTEVAKASSDRNFGLVFAAFFGLLGALGLWYGSGRWPIWFGLAVVMLILALAAPKVLAPLNRVWMRFGLLLHAVISPIMLGVMFYGCVTPIGFLMRRFPETIRFDCRFEPEAREATGLCANRRSQHTELFKRQYWT